LTFKHSKLYQLYSEKANLQESAATDNVIVPVVVSPLGTMC